MTFTRRERTIITVTIAALGLFVADRYAMTPLLDRYHEARTRREALEAELARAQSMLDRRRILEPRWRQMLDGGLARDAATAESQTLHAVRDWAEQAGLNLASLRPERSRETTPLRQVTVHAAGAGSMRSVSRFIYLVETAPIPVKVTMMQLGARQEGTDDLTLQVRLSTLYLADDGKDGET